MFIDNRDIHDAIVLDLKLSPEGPKILEAQHHKPSGFTGYDRLHDNTMDQQIGYLSDKLSAEENPFIHLFDDKVFQNLLGSRSLEGYLPKEELLLKSFPKGQAIKESDRILDNLENPREVVLKTGYDYRGEGVAVIKNPRKELPEILSALFEEIDYNNLDERQKRVDDLISRRPKFKNFLKDLTLEPVLIIQERVKSIPVDDIGNIYREISFDDAQNSKEKLYDPTMRMVVKAESEMFGLLELKLVDSYWKMPKYPLNKKSMNYDPDLLVISSVSPFEERDGPPSAKVDMELQKEIFDQLKTGLTSVLYSCLRVKSIKKFYDNVIDFDLKDGNLAEAVAVNSAILQNRNRPLTERKEWFLENLETLNPKLCEKGFKAITGESVDNLLKIETAKNSIKSVLDDYLEKINARAEESPNDNIRNRIDYVIDEGEKVPFQEFSIKTLDRLEESVKKSGIDNPNIFYRQISVHIATCISICNTEKEELDGLLNHAVNKTLNNLSELEVSSNVEFLNIKNKIDPLMTLKVLFENPSVDKTYAKVIPLKLMAVIGKSDKFEIPIKSQVKYIDRYIENLVEIDLEVEEKRIKDNIDRSQPIRKMIFARNKERAIVEYHKRKSDGVKEQIVDSFEGVIENIKSDETIGEFTKLKLVKSLFLSSKIENQDEFYKADPMSPPMSGNKKALEMFLDKANEAFLKESDSRAKNIVDFYSMAMLSDDVNKIAKSPKFQIFEKGTQEYMTNMMSLNLQKIEKAISICNDTQKFKNAGLTVDLSVVRASRW